MSSYQRSPERQGFSSSDIREISDHLVDAVVAWGTPADVVGHAERLRQAGADHVHLTVLGENGQPTGLPAAQLLAAEFG